jgi:hypothetical protein
MPNAACVSLKDARGDARSTVTRERQLKSRVDGDAVDRPDDGKRAEFHLVDDVVVHAALVHLEHPLGVAQVDPSAERTPPGGGQHYAFHRSIHTKLPEGFREGEKHGLRDGVDGLRGVDDHHGHAGNGREAVDTHRHRCASGE